MISSLYYIAVLLGTAIFCISTVLLLQKPFFKLAVSATKQLDVLFNSDLGESEKDRLILRNLSQLLKYLFLSLFGMMGTVALGIVPVLIYSAQFPDEAIDTSSLWFYLCMVAGSFVLFFFKKKSDYSYWSKLLHYLILDHYQLGRYLYKREISKYLREETVVDKPFVLVTGLARAGTTALTNLLYDPSFFHSIRYSNVPFLMAPRSWKKLYHPKNNATKERAHGDAVAVGEQSVEALEEYFFKVFLNDEFIQDHHLEKHELSPTLLSHYLKYQELFREQNDTLYLAKNNNLLLRFESFTALKANIRAVFIFRNPIDHAQSLLRQHQNFCAQQTEDPFVLQYMNWMGHHEFGQNHKAFKLNEEHFCSERDPSTIDYWLCLWVDYHQYFLQIDDKTKVILVHYDDLLKSPDALKRSISNQLDISFHESVSELFNPRRNKDKTEVVVDSNLKSSALEIYEQLVSDKLPIDKA